MDRVNITIAGIAVPGNKKRTRRYVDKATGEWRTMAYNPAHVQKWMTQCRHEAQIAMAGNPPLDSAYDPPTYPPRRTFYSPGKRKVPLGMSLQVFLPIPQSFSNREREAVKAGVLRPTTRPDMDNYFKAIADSFLGIVFYDDSSIVSYLPPFGKWYSDKPLISVSVMRLIPDSQQAPLWTPPPNP